MGYPGSTGNCIMEEIWRGWKKGKATFIDFFLVWKTFSYDYQKWSISIDRFQFSYNEKFHNLFATGIPINPQSWCHQCTNIDTRSGIIWSSHNQIVLIDLIKETSSFLSMGKFCLTKWFLSSGILTKLDRHHFKVRNV